ncbi:hypothetical protein BC359_20525 (plasmid) [Priestia flexa]|nr:hypothetical protein BC359_20525 [Priestia flexa]
MRAKIEKAKHVFFSIHDNRLQFFRAFRGGVYYYLKISSCSFFYCYSFVYAGYLHHWELREEKN